MSKPRITMTISNDGSFFELFLNEAGRSKLIRELQALDETDEHLHLDPDGIGDIVMSTKAYGDGQTVISYGKTICGRTSGMQSITLMSWSQTNRLASKAEIIDGVVEAAT